MQWIKIRGILVKYLLVFMGISIFLFTVFKFVPLKIVSNDFPGNSIKTMGIHKNIIFQYFYFLHSMLVGSVGYTYTPFYSGTVIRAVSITLPETVLFLISIFALSYTASYFIGLYSGTAFKTTKTLNMNIFPLLFFYLVSGIVLLSVFAGILGWFPAHGILSSSSTALNRWISSTGNIIYISRPTNIILLDSIIHSSPTVLLNFLNHIVLPFFSLFIPTTIYLSVYISHETSIEYNKAYMKAGITRNAFMDNYIIYIRRGIRSRVLKELKSVFVIFMGGMVIISYLFLYMNIGEFAIYSFLNYDYGIMGGIYSLFILAIMVIIFDLFIDVINSGGKDEI